MGVNPEQLSRLSLDKRYKVMEMYNPSHPGEILKEEYLSELNISVTEFAINIKVSRQVLSAILNEKAGISPAMALKLSKALGTTPEFWLNMQMQYGLWQAKQTTNLDEVKVVYKHKADKVLESVKRGLRDSANEKISELDKGFWDDLNG